MKKILLSFLMFLPLMASSQQDDDVKVWVVLDNICYQLCVGDYAIVIYDTYGGSDFYSGDIVIPASVTYEEVNYNVTKIGDDAFRGCSKITSVTIPNSVTSIGEQAFKECSSLTSVTIPNSVTSIGGSAFVGCSSLTSITIPASVTDIGVGAFSGSGLTSITISNGVTTIGEGVFQACRNLTSITIPNSVTSIGEQAFQECSSLASITIPNSVTSIGNETFRDCSSLTSITIPSGVNTIKLATFSGCSKLASLTIPNSVTSIGKDAFQGCSSLTSVTIPNNVTSIGEQAFQECSSLTSIIIPDGVTSIGRYAFVKCTSLKSIEIPNSVTSIETGTFSQCCSLVSITIPNGVTTIGNGAFGSCGIASINIPNSVTSIEDAAFMDCSSLTSITIPNSVTSMGQILFWGCTSLTTVSISNNVSTLEFGVFYGCSSLKSITIPNSVASIAGNAFTGCSALQSVTSLAVNPPTIEDWTFDNYDIPLYVPYASLGSYREASGWSNFTNILAFDAPDTKYTLTYKVDGEVYKTYQLEEGATITPEPAPTKEGYTFSGWSDIPATMPAKDVTVTGTFTINKYKLIYKVDGVEYKKYDVEYGTTITPEPAPTKEGYTFSGWSDIPKTMPAKDVTVTGTFTINSYKLKYKVDDELYKEYYYEFGAAITPEPEPTKEGYTFSGWSDIPKTMPAHKVTVNGYFTKNDEPVQNITQDNVVYQIEGGSVTVTQAEDASGDVKIEASVVIDGTTYEVTAIASEAFKGCTGLTSVEIPNSITTIGENAFEGCTGLCVIMIGNGIKEIASKAFANIFSSNARTRSGVDGLHVYCNAEVVPATSADAFEGTDIANATLHVLDDLVETYKSVSPWNGFGTIIGLSGTGIKTISIDTSDASIFDLQGNRLNNLQKGVNVVRTKDGKMKKIFVK